MILPAEFNWLESYLNNDSLWLEDAVNWEEAFDLVLTDFTIYNFLTTPFFFGSFFFLDSFTKLSFLDLIFMLETNKAVYSRELYDLFLWDITSVISNKFLPLQFLFYTDYQDFMVIMLYYSPELMLGLSDFINSYWMSTVFSFTPAIVFDLFSDSLNTAISEFAEYVILFFFFIWIVVIFINIFQLIKWNNPFFKIFFFFFFIEQWWLLRLMTIKKN